MLSSDILNPLLNSAFTREITWFEASNRFPLDEFVETFHNMRRRVQESLDGLTDAQVAYASSAHSIWSISESVTHLVFTQGFYINKLLDVSTSTLPHIAEAARGFGEGAKTGIPADQLRQQMVLATEQITTAIEGTRNHHDLAKTEVNEFFGLCNYQTWALLLLAHEVDHLKQIVAMRRLARAEA
jgi:DinB family protein